MAYLVLEDGSVYEGEGFGATRTDVIGEVVFNTGMTGYQEILTDPSCYGQIVLMTYPLIGNYGVNWEDPESLRPQVKAFAVRELCEVPSNWHSEGSLNDYLKRHGIMGIQGIDTRALTRILRSRGTMRGVLSERMPVPGSLAAMRSYAVVRPVDAVTCAERFEIPGKGPTVAVLDLGLKASILTSLRRRGCRMIVYPAGTPPSVILRDEPDGLLLTNGPGDPKDNADIVENIRGLTGRLPILGICLGHLLLALACGADTQPLRYGHRGSNHPVKDIAKDRVYITTQNHGYSVVEDSLTKDMIVSHRNWNDSSIEGIRYTGHPSFSVQFHPKASPGIMDTGYLFDEFIGELGTGSAGKTLYTELE
ncbi:MAG: carbamoyl phosphate synthase small subunit [Clostridiales bacterium]|nr:carbamoyl phosphate synthase small subunit [Clostridiales bacterium]